MDAREVIAWYERGITFECGCVERGLHPAVKRALEAGSLSVKPLLACAEHGAPALTEPTAELTP